MKGLARDLLSELLKLCFLVISLKVFHYFFSAWILNSNFTLTPNLTLEL